MARLLQFDNRGVVVRYETSGDTAAALGRNDVLINPDMSQTTSPDVRDWRVVNGIVREMTEAEKTIRDETDKQQQRDSIDNDNRIDPVVGMIALKQVLKAANKNLHDQWVAAYKTMAGL